MDFIVGTDGLCKNNQAKGGMPGSWAFAVFKTDGETYIGHKKGTSKSTTNNEMELQAIVEALHWADKHNKTIKILSDSSYCVKGLTEWYDGWVRRGWKTAKNEPVANMKLFQKAHLLLLKTNSEIEWVKGHAGHVINERADMFCNEAYLGECW